MSNEVSPEDDASILDETELWRRIAPTQWVHANNLKRLRPSTSAFDNHPDGSPMSVAIALQIVDGIEGMLRGHEQFGVVAFKPLWPDSSGKVSSGAFAGTTGTRSRDWEDSKREKGVG